MKKLILFLPLIMTLCLLTSCKQNYTCTCTFDANGGDAGTSELKLTKADAESACSNANMKEGVTCVLELVN